MTVVTMTWSGFEQYSAAVLRKFLISILMLLDPLSINQAWVTLRV